MCLFYATYHFLNFMFFDALKYYQTHWSIQRFSVNLENNRDAYEGVTIEYKAYVDMFVEKWYYSYISLA